MQYSLQRCQDLNVKCLFSMYVHMFLQPLTILSSEAHSDQTQDEYWELKILSLSKEVMSLCVPSGAAVPHIAPSCAHLNVEAGFCNLSSQNCFGASSSNLFLLYPSLSKCWSSYLQVGAQKWRKIHLKWIFLCYILMSC